MDFNVQSTQLKKEEQKFARLALTFLYKTMETIYTLRCPHQVEFTEEDSSSCWFNLNIPRSNVLRQQLQSSFYHGWFSIDIFLSDTKEIVERWYLIHIPAKQTETLPSLAVSIGSSGINNNSSGRNSALKELKLHTYRRFTQIQRSIYCMIGALPATTLSIILDQFSTPNKRHLVASLSPFQKFPAQITSFCEQETAKFRFGPVVTPIGQSVVICHYRIDIQPLIPTPIKVMHNGIKLPTINNFIDDSSLNSSTAQKYNEILERATAVRDSTNKLISELNNTDSFTSSISNSSSTGNNYNGFSKFNIVRPTSPDPMMMQTSDKIKDTYGMSVPIGSPLMTPGSHIDIMSFVPDPRGQFEPLDNDIDSNLNNNSEIGRNSNSHDIYNTSNNNTNDSENNLNNYSANDSNTNNNENDSQTLMPINDFIDFLKSCENKKYAEFDTINNTDQQLSRVRDELNILKNESK